MASRNAGLLERLLLPENLIWSWRQVKKWYGTAHDWFDEGEIAAFELRLESNLREISRKVSSGSFAMTPLRPLAQPKNDDEDGNPRARQAFWVAIEDQVVWLALLNLVGPSIDQRMPYWSYGSRLYRPAWYEDKELRIGPYRHANAQIFLPFQRSWPRYRRNINWTARRMVRGRNYLAPLPEEEAKLEKAEALRQSRNEDERLKDRTGSDSAKVLYLDAGFWKEHEGDVFWAGMDFEKFYAKVKIKSVKENLLEYSAEESGELAPLLEVLTDFKLDLRGWHGDLAAIGLEEKQKSFANLPTGLIASGFLANVAMLKIDDRVNQIINERRSIAHFRFVDDHVFLAQSFEGLVEWVAEYRGIVADANVGANPNEKKFEPSKFYEYLRQVGLGAVEEQTEKAAREATAADPAFPTALMTTTLAKVSALAHLDFDVLNGTGQVQVMRDLEQLLLAPLPDHELKSGTRISFAATMLASFAPRKRASTRDLVVLDRQLTELQKELAVAAEVLDKYRPESGEHKSAALRHRFTSTQIREVGAQRTSRHRISLLGVKKEARRTLALLEKALLAEPEKLRLWDRTFSFCLLAGVSIKTLRRVIEQHEEANPMTAPYIRAKVMQSLALHLLRAVRIVRDEDCFREERRTAADFIARAVLCEIWKVPETPLFYEENAHWLYKVAVGTAVLALNEHSSLLAAKSRKPEAIKGKAIERGAVDFVDIGAAWKSNSPRRLAVWLWWAESRTLKYGGSQASSAFSLGASKLALDHEEDWQLVRLFPKEVPGSLAERVLKGPYVGPPLEISWLVEALPTIDTGEVDVSVESLGARSFMSGTEGKLDLVDWVARVRRRHQEDPYDPRCGEWTALFLVSEVAKLLTAFDIELFKTQRLETPPLSPHNFVVDERLFELESPTWESWRSRLAESQAGSVEIRRVNEPASLLLDRRYSPAWVTESPLDDRLGHLHGLGLILLGLLRRDFEWPAFWNVYGQERSAMDLARQDIESLPCSSFTTSILEATLTSRAKERPLLSVFGGSGDSDEDTRNDPPNIETVEDFIKYVEDAKGILEKYQISIDPKSPRQLVPVSLGQLSRNPWQQTGGEKTPQDEVDLE